jgi:SAM-dependent methyltransferase
MVEAAREHVADVRLGALPDLPFVGGTFDAAVANFVVNHVGDPAAALDGMRRVVRPGGIVAVTVWPSPSPTQQTFAEAIRAAGVDMPASPRLDPERDFARTVDGLSGLFSRAGFVGVEASVIAWDLRIDPEIWWAGAAGGLSAVGEVITNQPPEMVAKVKHQYDRLVADRLDRDGVLTLPVTAVLAAGRV